MNVKVSEKFCEIPGLKAKIKQTVRHDLQKMFSKCVVTMHTLICEYESSIKKYTGHGFQKY